MKTVVITKAGNYDQLQIQTFPDPYPARGQVLIEVKACGVNFADCCVRMGVYRSAKEFVGWPITPGFEVAGVVTDVGEGVTKFSPGQKVIAVTLFGGYTTHLCVSEDLVFALPHELSFAEGAALPAVFMTAYYALFELAHPKANQVILVHSAAGGVGSALVQLGQLAGCHVVGVVGASHKVEHLKRLGVNDIIDKSRQDLWAESEKLAPAGFDIILDANGVETLSQSYQHLGPGGKLVVYGFHTMFSKGRGTPNWFKMFWDYIRTPRFNPLNMTNENRSVLAFNLSYLFGKKDLLQSALQTIISWHSEKKYILPSITTYPLEQVAEAHRALESGQTTGKIVLIINDFY